MTVKKEITHVRRRIAAPEMGMLPSHNPYYMSIADRSAPEPLSLFQLNHLHLLASPQIPESLTQWMPITPPTTHNNGSLLSSDSSASFASNFLYSSPPKSSSPKGDNNNNSHSHSHNAKPPLFKSRSSTEAATWFANYLTCSEDEAEDNNKKKPDIEEIEYAAAVSSPAAAFLSSFLTPTCTPPSADADGLEIAGFTLGKTVGRGGFSTVKVAVSPSGGTVAVKIVHHAAFDDLPTEERLAQRARFSHEEKIWLSLSHENILPLFQAYHSPQATYLFTLYCPSGTLLDILKREGNPTMEQTDVGCMFRQVVKGLRYMHETMRLVHGDIKLENILLDESGVCRITDFGLSRRIEFGVGGEAPGPQAGQEAQAPASAACPTTSTVTPPPHRGNNSNNNNNGDGAGAVGGSTSAASSSTTDKQRRDRSRGRRTGTAALPIHLSLRMRTRSRPRNNSEPVPPSELAPSSHPEYEFQPGSLPYAAPELLLPRAEALKHAHHNHNHNHNGHAHGHVHGFPRYAPNPAQDMWALGVLLYTLLTGGFPFRDTFEPRLQMKILRGIYTVPPSIGPQAEAVLKGCLETDVNKRWTVAMVDDAAWGIGYGDVNSESSQEGGDVGVGVGASAGVGVGGEKKSVLANERCEDGTPCSWWPGKTRLRGGGGCDEGDDAGGAAGGAGAGDSVPSMSVFSESNSRSGASTSKARAKQQRHRGGDPALAAEGEGEDDGDTRFVQQAHRFATGNEDDDNGNSDGTTIAYGRSTTTSGSSSGARASARSTTRRGGPSAITTTTSTTTSTNTNTTTTAAVSLTVQSSSSSSSAASLGSSSAGVNIWSSRARISSTSPTAISPSSRRRTDGGGGGGGDTIRSTSSRSPSPSSPRTPLDVYASGRGGDNDEDEDAALDDDDDSEDDDDDETGRSPRSDYIMHRRRRHRHPGAGADAATGVVTSSGAGAGAGVVRVVVAAADEDERHVGDGTRDGDVEVDDLVDIDEKEDDDDLNVPDRDRDEWLLLRRRLRADGADKTTMAALRERGGSTSSGGVSVVQDEECGDDEGQGESVVPRCGGGTAEDACSAAIDNGGPNDI